MIGPDGNLFLDQARTRMVTIPAGSSWGVSGSFDAANEVAIILYDAQTTARIFTFGNFSRASLGMQAIGTPAQLRVLVTAWHKNTPPNGGQPWFQSRCRFTSRVRGSTGRFVFAADDGGGDNDFNDAVATITYP